RWLLREQPQDTTHPVFVPDLRCKDDHGIFGNGQALREWSNACLSVSTASSAFRSELKSGLTQVRRYPYLRPEHRVVPIGKLDEPEAFNPVFPEGFHSSPRYYLEPIGSSNVVALRPNCDVRVDPPIDCSDFIKFTALCTHEVGIDLLRLSVAIGVFVPEQPLVKARIHRNKCVKFHLNIPSASAAFNSIRNAA